VQRPTMRFVATRPPSRLICRRCIGFASDWSASVPASPIKSGPSFWNVALRCGKPSGFCMVSCRASLLRRPMCCRHAWCTSLKDWPRTGGATRWAHQTLVRRDHRACATGCRLRVLHLIFSQTSAMPKTAQDEPVGQEANDAFRSPPASQTARSGPGQSLQWLSRSDRS
jgi:hypothetical protein